MPDGTIYAGFSPDTQKPMYAAAEDTPVTVTFNRAAEWAAELEVCGYKDWRVPTKEELNVLYQNKDEGFLKGTFNKYTETGVSQYWSSTPVKNAANFAYDQNFFCGRCDWEKKKSLAAVRFVRG
jgi:hypothetical protein